MLAILIKIRIFVGIISFVAASISKRSILIFALVLALLARR